MPVQVVDCKCSGCGAGVAPSMTVCEYCGKPVVITSFNSIVDRAAPEVNKLLRALEKDPDTAGDLSALADFTKGSCYLKLKLYDKAIEKFESAIEQNLDNPEAYFYAAVCQLKGRKACLTPLPNLKKALEYIEAANSIEPRGVFYLLAAYIKLDFFAKKYLRIDPDWRQEMDQALAANLSTADADTLFGILGVPCPIELKDWA